MDRAPRSKGATMLKYLQKAATFSISNHSISPRARGSERLSKMKGVPASTASIIPTEVQRKKKCDDDIAEEPTSPKVTCIGQIKHKKASESKKEIIEKKKKLPSSSVSRMLSLKVRPSGRLEVGEVEEKGRDMEEAAVGVAARAPALGKLRKFASGRETLAGFDWEKVARGNSGYEEEKEEVTKVVNVYHSAPLVLRSSGVVAAEPKEVGLWRRRAMAAPMPLLLVKK